MSKKTPEIIRVQNFLKKKWDFRYNEVLGRIEFKSNTQKGYQILTDYDLNSIHLELTENGYSFTIDGLRKLLKSKFVPKYNPFYDYFKNLPVWDERTDYIDMLASTVTTTTSDEFFKLVLKKWIVAMVASLLKDEVINHTFLVFTGAQGVGKTTWINNLVPKALDEYYYAGAINPNNSDSKIQLAENMLINIDELQGFTFKGLEDLKALITIRDIKVRRPYASIHESLPHRASFAGSINSTDFLSDTTGNRRFLCFEVEDIAYEHNISMENVYAQALHLLKDGFRFYLNKEEIAELNEHNEAFVKRSMEEDLLLKYIQPCSQNDDEAVIGNTTDIVSTMAATNEKLRVDSRTVQRVGKLLRKHDFERFKQNGAWVYAYKVIVEPTYGYSN